MKYAISLFAGLAIGIVSVGCSSGRPEPQSDPNAPPGSMERGGNMPKMPVKRPDEGKAPTEGDSKATEGDAKPAEGDAKPVEGDAKPVEGDAKPAEGDAKPAEGDAKPAESTEKPE